MRIASVGDNCADIYINDNGRVMVGGNGVNLAVAVRRSGVECSYFGMVGNDKEGAEIIEALQNEQVGTEGIDTVEGKTAYTKIDIIHGDRFFVEEDLGVQKAFHIREENLQRISGYDLVHYTAFTNWPTAFQGGIENYAGMVCDHVERFHHDGVPVSMDFSDGDMTELLQKLKGKVDIGFFSRSGLSDGEIRTEADKLMAYGFKLVVLTCGKHGSFAYDGQQLVYEDIFEIEVVDPLGAGDSYMGAFLSSYVQKKPLIECIRYATWYAAQVCSRYGGF